MNDPIQHVPEVLVPHPKFDEILSKLLSITVSAKRSSSELRSNTRLFFEATASWLVSPDETDDRTGKTQGQKKEEFASLGFDGEVASASVKELMNDSHLRGCCSIPVALSFVLGKQFVDSAAGLVLDGADQVIIQHQLNALKSLLYQQGRYRRIAYTHIFNFDTPEEGYPLGGGRFLRKLTQSDIPQLLNDSNRQGSLLHPPEAGTVYVCTVEEEFSEVTDGNWLADRRTEASQVITLLQYFKDGIVGVGYSALHFNPFWVNEIRKFGLLFQGSPRRRSYADGTRRYVLTRDELEIVLQWQAVVSLPEVAKRMGSSDIQLRKTIERAGTYFEASFDREDVGDRLIALSIALEALFSPDDKSELSHRICQQAAVLLGETPNDRRAVFASLRTMYKNRSKLIHGTYDPEEYRLGKFTTEEQLVEWTSYIRRSILCFIVLFIEGTDTREAILQRLSESSFDDSIGDRLRSDCLVNQVLSKHLI